MEHGRGGRGQRSVANGSAECGAESLVQCRYTPSAQRKRSCAHERMRTRVYMHSERGGMPH